MPTLIKDLIDIPERIQRGDFVLRLSEGVSRPEETLRDYVVTPELRTCFDDALSFIHSALQGHSSKATYLHGSFGTGKSHFMAMLDLILEGHVGARAIPELAPVITKHNEWLPGKKLLLVPYHMIGAHDMESGILGGYVEFMRRTHPEAPVPGVYKAEGLFQDAQNLRKQMGDERFFQALNEATRGSVGWGEFEAGWDAERFEIALLAEPGSEERSRLIGDLVGKFFGSYDTQASGRGEAFLSLDKGLSVISKHAAALGYEALILFLDELILWLASHAADLHFVQQEAQKMAKLVEAQTADRPIPIISFVARQRDLRDFVGENVPGAQQLNFGEALGWQEGRFHTITLEDRNLPAIAEKRVLKCKGEAARQELDAAFDQTGKIREAVMNTLLTSEGDRAMFRKVYPFSPALVQTLIAVSSVLQRERTALKVMMQLLVDQRETLKVGDIVPVGDLFDVIAHGDEAFSPEMAIHFDNAKRLYHQKLLPALEKQYGRHEELAKLSWDDARRTQFRNDDRLVKTLLLSALVPGVESLRGLNAERLAALNHGTIRTPIPGREGQEVLRRVRGWAAEVGEIRIGEEPANPSITVQLSGVDTEGIIEQARREDNQGNRIRRVRQMLFEQLGIEGGDEFSVTHEFTWHNTQRFCEVLFKNIRELPDTSLEATGDDWKLLIDFPFDEAGRTPRDDVSRLQGFRQSHPEGTKTQVWIPSFLSVDAQRDLGMLVILEHILTGERFAGYSVHLSPTDRQAAKSLLENQRSVLRQRVMNHLEAAYGLEAVTPGSIDTTHDLELSERFESLLPGFEPQPPAAANLAGAMRHLLGQGLAHEFPAHPDFEAEVTRANLRKVHEQVSRAVQSEDGRVAIDKPLRPLLRAIANPMLLGEMGYDSTHFVIGHHWKSHFTRKAAETGKALSVGELRRWINEPKAMGMPRDAENLVIMTFAEQANYSLYLHGVPSEATLTNLPDPLELRQEPLPGEERWTLAMKRAGGIFGVAVSPLRKATNVSSLVTGVQGKAVSARSACQNYCQRLRLRLERLGIATAGVDRLKTASATMALVERLCSVSSDGVVEALVAADIATSEAAMLCCFGQAKELSERLDATDWEIIEAVGKLTDHRKTAAAAIRAKVQDALTSDEHVVLLAAALKEAQSKAVRLLSESPPKPKPKPKPTLDQVEIPDLEVEPDVAGVKEGVEENLAGDEAISRLSQLREGLQSGERLRVSLRWRVESD